MSMQLAMSVAKNEFIVGSKYRLLRKIGSGSFGDIYLGINISNGEVRSTVSRETTCQHIFHSLSYFFSFLIFHSVRNKLFNYKSVSWQKFLLMILNVIKLLTKYVFFMILLLVTWNIHCFPLENLQLINFPFR